jgi:hypothetical protein
MKLISIEQLEVEATLAAEVVIGDRWSNFGVRKFTLTTH